MEFLSDIYTAFNEKYLSHILVTTSPCFSFLDYENIGEYIDLQNQSQQD